MRISCDASFNEICHRRGATRSWSVYRQESNNVRTRKRQQTASVPSHCTKGVRPSALNIREPIRNLHQTGNPCKESLLQTWEENVTSRDVTHLVRFALCSSHAPIAVSGQSRWPVIKDPVCGMSDICEWVCTWSTNVLVHLGMCMMR